MKLSPKVPSCGMLGLSWASIQFAVHLDRSGPIQPNMTNWRQLGLQLGPRERSLGQVKPLSGRPAPSWGQVLRIRRSTLTHVTAISIVFLGTVRAKPCCRGGAKCPPQDHVVHAKRLSPACVQMCTSCAMLDPSSAPLKARQGRPSLTPASFWLGQVGPLLSSLSYSLGAGGSCHEVTRIRFLKLSSLGHLFATALHAKPSLRPNVHKLRHVPKLYAS